MDHDAVETNGESIPIMEENEHYDLVAPFTCGYSTPLRIGDGMHSKDPWPKKYLLKKGICAGVFENGTIFFDFARCEETPIVIHRESLLSNVDYNKNGALEGECVAKRLRRTEDRQRLNQSFYRTVLLAHMLLLENAARLIGGVYFETPRIETIHDTYMCYGIPNVPRPKFRDDHNVLHLRGDVIDKSFSDLDVALSAGSGSLLRALEFHKLSHYRMRDQRFAESLILSWTICENMIGLLWRRMIDDLASSSEDRMTKERSRKLHESSASTTSARIEKLQLAGKLPLKHAENLSKIRLARNKSLHEFVNVDEEICLDAITTCAQLISYVFELKVCGTNVARVGGEGGGRPLEAFKSHCPDVDLRDAYDG